MHLGGGSQFSGTMGAARRNALSDTLRSPSPGPVAGGVAPFNSAGCFQWRAARHHVRRAFSHSDPLNLRALGFIFPPGLIARGSLFFCNPRSSAKLAGYVSEKFQNTSSMHVHSHARSLSACANSLSVSGKRHSL